MIIYGLALTSCISEQPNAVIVIKSPASLSLTLAYFPLNPTSNYGYVKLCELRLGRCISVEYSELALTRAKFVPVTVRSRLLPPIL